MNSHTSCMCAAIVCTILLSACTGEKSSSQNGGQVSQNIGGVKLGAKKDRPVRIVAVTTAPGVCEVDYPVVVVHAAKHTLHFISDDQSTPFWVNFPNPVSTSPIPVTPDSGMLSVTGQGYYQYEIWDQYNPNVIPPTYHVCKSSTDDHDTGVNVKP